jgi:hypothetical protein
MLPFAAAMDTTVYLTGYASGRIGLFGAVHARIRIVRARYRTVNKSDSSKGTASSCPTFCDNLGCPAVFECSTSGGTFCCGLSSCCGSKSSSILTLGRVSTIGYITKGVLTPMTPTATTTAVSSTLTASSTEVHRRTLARRLHLQPPRRRLNRAPHLPAYYRTPVLVP